MTYLPKLILPFACGVACMVNIAGAAMIIDDIVTGNGDATDDGGTAGIVTAWSGFEGAGSFGGLIPAGGDDDGFPGDEISDVDDPTNVFDDADVEFGGTTTAESDGDPVVTYGGTIAAGSYNVLIQFLSFNNFDGFPAIDVTLGGLSATSTGTNTLVAVGGDEVWEFNYDVGPGSAAIGQPLTLALTVDSSQGTLDATDRSNASLGHVRINYQVPEPSAFALLALCGLVATSSRRS